LKFRINSGKILFRIYEQTKNPKYKKALDLLYSQFEGQPRNADGGFWHKNGWKSSCQDSGQRIISDSVILTDQGNLLSNLLSTC